MFILTDDQSARDAASLGNTVLKTPNIDRLARESMNFTNAFTSTAMCVPSRASLYTGLHPMRHGAHPNHAPIRAGVPSLAKKMDELGYRVGLIGKIHVNPIDSFGFHYVRDLLDFTWDSKLTKEEIKIAMDTLGKEDKPFVLFVCISNPHTPWPAEWEGKQEDIVLPDYLFDNDATRKTVSYYYADVEMADMKVGEALDAAAEVGLLEDMLVFFSGDHGAEFVHGKYTLYDAGIKVPFLVRWPGIIRPGVKCDALIQFVDVLPTLIDIAGGEANDEFDGRSIRPLFTDPGGQVHPHIYATSSKDGNKTDYPIKAIRTKDYKYIINPEYEETYSSWITDSSLGTDWPGYERHYGYWLTWLGAAATEPEADFLVSTYLHRPAEELYDLNEDPFELINLARDPDFYKVKQELRSKLRKWMLSQNDLHYSEEFFNQLEQE